MLWGPARGGQFMSDLPAITGQRLIKALKKLGFEVIRSKGSHHSLRHADGRARPSQFILVKQSVGVSWLKSEETVKSLYKISKR